MNTNRLLEKIRDKEPNSFDTFILSIIILSSILIGLETIANLYSEYYLLFNTLDIIILTIFCLEIIIKMFVHGKKPWRYYLDPWNIFDFIIVLSCFLPYLLSISSDDTHAILALRVFRLLRSFRVFRALRIITSLKPLQLIIETLLKSIPSLSFVILLLGLLFYVYAIIGYSIFGKYDDNFCNLGNTVITLFTSLSGGWPDFMVSLMKTGDFEYYFAPFYFISFYFIAGLIILNLFVGVIVDQLSSVKLQKEAEELREGYQDDLTTEQNKVMEDLELKVSELNEKIKELQIVLNKNKTMY